MRKRGLYWQARPKAGGKLGKWRSTRCTDLKAAQAVLGEWERSLADPTYAAKAGATLDQAASAVKRNLTAMVKVGKRSEATQSYYEQKLGTLISVLGGDTLLCEITPGRVDSFVDVRRLDEVTEHTIAKELGVLRVTLKAAKRNGWWAGDIDAILPHAFSTQAKPRERFLSSMAELGKILRAVHSQDIAAQIAFSVATGAEAQAIRRAQRADLTDRFVAVHGKKRPSRERVVPVVASWQATLLLFVRQNALGGDPALFVHTQGIPKALRLACEKLGLPHVCPNDLRRTFNVWMDAAGVPVALRAQAMGHASTRILDKFTYGKLSPDMLRDRMREVLDGRSNGRAVGMVGGPGNGYERGATKKAPRDRPDGRGIDRGQEVQGGAGARAMANGGGVRSDTPDRSGASSAGLTEQDRRCPACQNWLDRFGRCPQCEEVADGRQGVSGGDAACVSPNAKGSTGRRVLAGAVPVADRGLNVGPVCQSGVTDAGVQGRTEPDIYTATNDDLPLEMAPRAGIEPATYGLTGQTATEGKEG